MNFLNTVLDTFMTLLPSKRKTTSAWVSFNAVCCPHNGESTDTRGRGGIRANPEGSVTYHCFNCGFTTGFYPGRPLSYKFRKLLSWLGADDNTIRRLVIEAIRIKDLIDPTQVVEVERAEVSYTPKALPENSASFQEWTAVLSLMNEDDEVPEQLVNAVDYISKRGIKLADYDFYITSETAYNLHKRVLIPFYWKGDLIGYTGRALDDDVKPKFHNCIDHNYVFNTDKQLKDSKFVIVCEGPFDAMSIDGVAILSNDCSEVQADIIDELGREVIVVPDFDKHINKRGKEVWPGEMLVDQAIEYGWSVSFPVWRDTCKDINDAVLKYGKLFVIKSILDAREHNKLKINLMKRGIQ